MVLDLGTLAVVATAINLILNLLFLFMGLQKGASAELRFWSIGMMCNFASGLLLGLRVFHDSQIAGQLGGMLFIAYFVNVLLGFQAFAGRKPLIRQYALLPLIYLLVLLPFAGTSIPLKIGPAIIFFLCSLLSILIAYELYTLSKKEKLKSIWIGISLYVGFFVTLVVFLGLSIRFPVVETENGIVSFWLGWMALENTLHKSACALIMLVLVKDRADEKLQRLAETDMLTGIKNRRAFVAGAERLLAHPHDQFALAIFDLDHFKSINDHHGHMAGDYALQAFTQCVSRTLPEDMVFGRLGGEEFAIFTPVQSRQQVVAKCDEIRTLVAAKPLRFNGRDVCVSVSVGLAFSGESGPGLDAMMAAADCALYIAKEQGRNRLCEFTSSQRLLAILQQDENKQTSLVDSPFSRRSVRLATRSANR